MIKVRTTYRMAGAMFRLFFRVAYQFELKGLENIPQDRVVVLASNHQSNLDPPLIGAFFPREISFVAKKQLFARSWMSRLIRHFNAIPLDRAGVDLRAIREMRTRLRQGQCLLVFPEGTRSRDGTLGRPRAGLGLIVNATEADVLPVLISGTRQRPGIPGFRPLLRLEFGPCVAYADLVPDAPEGGDDIGGRGRPARAEFLTAAIFQHIERMHKALE